MNQFKSVWAAIALVCSMAMLSMASLAAPKTWYEVVPSAIVIYANNPEDRAYDCSIWYVWSHEAYRTTRAETVSESVHVAPQSNGAIYSQPLAYMYVQIEQGPKIECN
jgi:hypothetical protein